MNLYHINIYLSNEKDEFIYNDFMCANNEKEICMLAKGKLRDLCAQAHISIQELIDKVYKMEYVDLRYLSDVWYHIDITLFSNKLEYSDHQLLSIIETKTSDLQEISKCTITEGYEVIYHGSDNYISKRFELIFANINKLIQIFREKSDYKLYGSDCKFHAGDIVLYRKSNIQFKIIDVYIRSGLDWSLLYTIEPIDITDDPDDIDIIYGVHESELTLVKKK